MELKLKTENRYEEIIKEYLEKNASVLLADKINNGVFVEKNGTRLLSRKTLKGCMEFIKNQARKESKNGVAMVEDSVVFGWAIHYFEENSILGELFNEDGSKYKESKPKETKDKTVTQESKKVKEVSQKIFTEKNEKKDKQKNPQMSFFDVLGSL